MTRDIVAIMKTQRQGRTLVFFVFFFPEPDQNKSRLKSSSWWVLCIPGSAAGVCHFEGQRSRQSDTWAAVETKKKSQLCELAAAAAAGRSNKKQ